MNSWIRNVGLFTYRWLPPVLIMGVIFWWSEQTDLPGAQSTDLVWWDFLLKKIAHVTEYAALFWAFSRALNWNKPMEEHSFKAAFILLIIYALTDEVHQSFTPGRHPKIADIGYDSLGGLLVYLKLKAFV